MEIVATYVPPSGADSAALTAELARPPAGATAVELRADLLPPGVDLGPLVAASPLPVVLTLRSRSEGGRGPDEPEPRRLFFERAVGLPVLAFDLEAARDLDLVDRLLSRDRVILSVHPPEVPARLEAQALSLLGRGTMLVKLAPAVEDLGGVLEVLRVARALGRGPAGGRAVVLATGEAGRAVRLLGPRLAARVAYAAWEPGRAAAPGQYTAEELTAFVGDPAPLGRVFAVLGRPAGRSLSPRMHNAAYRALGLPDVFVPLEVRDEGELCRLLQPAGLGGVEEVGLRAGGFAVTMPWKEAALGRCSVVAPRAARARAVNTVLPRSGKVLGDCTDIDGITRSLLAAGVGLAGARGLVLGTGGSARAAVVGLQAAGCEVAVAGRDGGKVAAVARELGASSITPSEAGRCSIAVNATPAGTDGAPSELLESLRLAPGAAVVDLPYGPLPTRLQELAEGRGWTYIGGRQVLLWQGVAQFAAMTGMAPPVGAMAAALGLAGERP
ncbi:MAG TPA: type I 3-dehydroquinate dehydratase [Thermoanaerobaculaceae bacterium]|nr:type I 3-dehydroquinate dehydratase [Thermoanaerobaculaceae bacterium]HRS17090.1 type I 3-dehydroquinate dehydratase [Thermoanaerobaculaceae bacterium]